MICLVYLSSAATIPSAEVLSGIVQQSQRNNQQCDVTGLLCHYDGNFLQFLEGPEEAVNQTYDRISRDPRHRQLIQVQRRQIEERAFADWSMAVVKPDDISPAQRAFVQGLRDVEVAERAHKPAIEGFLQSFRAWLR
ncbi:BLUF domain-containing protein [Phenylobacterium deserti]|uniref:BLUF domain-containing protein n=1 Tax=Phenylobacterium deserti TaxID=1914756 RepID=UPI001402BC10|nr:BLUF domain-containing protein [Phenylobacterium deserti]